MVGIEQYIQRKMKEMKHCNKLIALLLSAALAAGVMTGCGSADTGPTPTTRPAAENREGEVNQQAHEAEHAVATDRTLTFGIQEYSIGVDPAQEVNTAWNCSRYGIGECLQFHERDSLAVRQLYRE